jgi:3-oxoacyl-[acyl-carrier-protein] synthase-3
VDNAALAARLGLSAEWIETFIGTRTRHFAADLDGVRPPATLAALCAEAGRRALRAAGTAPGEVGFVVLATATPDTLMPTTVAVAADLMGIDGVPAYQLQAGCAGAVQALALGSALVAAGAGPGLVLGGDVCAKHLDLRQDFRRMAPGALVNYVLFGDGAGAAVLSATPRPGSPGAPGGAGGAGAPGGVRLVAAEHRLGGLGTAPGQTVEWYGAADRDSGRPAVTEDYKAVEARVPGLAHDVCAGLLDRLGWPAAGLDHLLPPQLGGRMTARVTAGLRASLGLTDRTAEVSCVADTGNNGNALLFCQLERLLPALRPGHRAIGAAIESSKWISAGIAVEARP